MGEQANSILDMAMGAVRERVTMVMQQVIENIKDPNTKAEKKRSITVTIEFTPNSERNDVIVSSTVKAKLEATNPITSTFAIGHNMDGELIAAEKTNNLPGQLNLDGGEQKKGIVISLSDVRAI